MTLILGVADCNGNGGGATQAWTNGLNADGQAIVENWLFCDECDAGERDSVAALGSTAVPALGNVLRTIPDDWRRNVQSRSEAAARQALLTGADSSLYVRVHVDNFVATAQARSAKSLGDIKTPNAIAILRQAIGDSTAIGYRADVMRDLKGALVGATAARLQNYQPQAVAFLDTVWISRDQNVPWDRDETVILNGGPYPNDVMVGFRNNDTQLGIVAAALPGEYAFSIANVGAQDSQYFGDVRINSFPAPPVTVVPNFSAGPFPRVVLQSLARATSPPDFVHYFRFAPPAGALTITAKAEWMGPSQIDLVWDDCVNRSGFGSNPRRITGRVMDPSGNSLGGVTIRLVGTTMGTSSTPSGVFNFDMVPPGWSGQLLATRIGFAPATLQVWEGAGDVNVIVPPPATAVSTVTRNPSPNTVSHTIPPGACRLLGVVKADMSTAPTIVKLSLTSP